MSIYTHTLSDLCTVYIHTIYISTQVHRPSIFLAGLVEFLQQRQSQNELVRHET